MGKLLSAAEVARYREDGYLCPIRSLTAEDAAPLSRPARGGRGGGRRQPARPLQAQAASGLHLRPGADPPAADPRCDRGGDRAGHPVLGVGVLHQGAAHARLHQLAPGHHLLGPRGRGRRGHRLGRALALDARERLHAGRARDPQARGRAARRHLRRRQHALARPGDRGRGRRGARGRPGPRAGPDVAASRQDLPRLAREPVRRPADRLRDPLPAAARPSSRSGPTARRWCAARTASAISNTSRRPPTISRPRRSPATSACASGAWRS